MSSWAFSNGQVDQGRLSLNLGFLPKDKDLSRIVRIVVAALALAWCIIVLSMDSTVMSSSSSLGGRLG